MGVFRAWLCRAGGSGNDRTMHARHPLQCGGACRQPLGGPVPSRTFRRCRCAPAGQFPVGAPAMSMMNNTGVQAPEAGFTLLPAIDVREGRVVRLRQGDYASETRYPVEPLEAARAYAAAGAGWLHLVDLD